MLVKDLKQLLQNADDNLEVMLCKDDTFSHVKEENSGVIEFGEPCDENGKAIDVVTEKPLTVFALFH